MNRFALASLAFLSLGMTVRADENPMAKIIEGATTDERVAKTIDAVLRNIDKVKCGKSQCEMTTATELASPPVSVEQGREAMKRGIASAMLDWCGGDWQARVVRPMILQAKLKDGMNDRQVTILMALHASQHMPLKKVIEAKGPCPDNVKEGLARTAIEDPTKSGMDPTAPIPGVVETPGRDGESPQTAVILKSSRGSEGAVRAELIWIGRKHPGSKKTGQALIPFEGRQIDRIEVRLPDGASKTYHFDITDAFGLPQ